LRDWRKFKWYKKKFREKLEKIVERHWNGGNEMRWKEKVYYFYIVTVISWILGADVWLLLDFISKALCSLVHMLWYQKPFESVLLNIANVNLMLVSVVGIVVRKKCCLPTDFFFFWNLDTLTGGLPAKCNSYFFNMLQLTGGLGRR
jgi:hypothetical protein